MRDGAGARHNDCFFRNNQRLSLGGRVNSLSNEIVNRDGAIQDRASAEDSASFHDSSFINTGIPTNQDFILDNYRQRADRLKNSTDLRSRRNVAITPDLRSTANHPVP